MDDTSVSRHSLFKIERELRDAEVFMRAANSKIESILNAYWVKGKLIFFLLHDFLETPQNIAFIRWMRGMEWVRLEEERQRKNIIFADWYFLKMLQEFLLRLQDYFKQCELMRLMNDWMDWLATQITQLTHKIQHETQQVIKDLERVVQQIAYPDALRQTLQERVVQSYLDGEMNSDNVIDIIVKEAENLKKEPKGTFVDFRTEVTKLTEASLISEKMTVIENEKTLVSELKDKKEFLETTLENIQSLDNRNIEEMKNATLLEITRSIMAFEDDLEEENEEHLLHQPIAP